MQDIAVYGAGCCGVDEARDSVGKHMLMVRCPDFVRSSRVESTITSAWPTC
jgi:hypothetical protein